MFVGLCLYWAAKLSWQVEKQLEHLLLKYILEEALSSYREFKPDPSTACKHDSATAFSNIWLKRVMLKNSKEKMSESYTTNYTIHMKPSKLHKALQSLLNSHQGV